MKRELWRNALHLSVLSAFAFAEPLFDLLGKTPEFFVVRGSTAGDVVFFGAFLVHRSLPNRSGSDRRALLYSFQPGGFPHARNRVKTRAR